MGSILPPFPTAKEMTDYIRLQIEHVAGPVVVDIPEVKEQFSATAIRRPMDERDILVFHILRQVWYWRAPKEIHVYHPLTWWDAFKDRWYPKWMKRKWPPMFKDEKYVAAAYCFHGPGRKTEETLKIFNGGLWPVTGWHKEHGHSCEGE